MTERALALRWFDVEREREKLDYEIDAKLRAAGINYDEFTSDSYDGSIELFSCDPLTDAQQSLLWEMGFDRAWTHPGPEKVKSDERYYAKP